MLGAQEDSQPRCHLFEQRIHVARANLRVDRQTIVACGILKDDLGAGFEPSEWFVLMQFDRKTTRSEPDPGVGRGDIVRLVMAEGARFPTLAEFYYREVVERGMTAMRKLIEYGIARGEIHNQALTQFPQIVVAPALVAVIWQGLFGKQAPLDAVAMLKVHIDLIFGERSST